MLQILNKHSIENSKSIYRKKNLSNRYNFINTDMVYYSIDIVDISPSAQHFFTL